mmetsp:Transcript_43509/g.52182  ORF Transcript_43509/g.52182 Transcript_43509/m.52182 type:complete len:85 (-) Transcript_43509:359-613(-)
MLLHPQLNQKLLVWFMNQVNINFKIMMTSRKLIHPFHRETFLGSSPHFSTSHFLRTKRRSANKYACSSRNAHDFFNSRTILPTI